MRAASTSRFQLSGDQRHSRSHPVVDQLRGEDGRARDRRNRAGRAARQSRSGHPATARRRPPGCHGGSSLWGITAPTWPWAINSPRNQAHADHGIAGPRIGRHGKEAARAALAQGQRIERGAQQPAAERQPFGRNRLGRRGTDRAGPGDHRLTGIVLRLSDQGHCSSGFFGPALSAELLRGCQV